MQKTSECKQFLEGVWASVWGTAAQLPNGCQCQGRLNVFQGNGVERMLCSRQAGGWWGGGGLGRGACVETEGRSPGRRAARPDRRRRENEDESRRSFKFIVPAFRPFLRLPRRLCRHLISGMNSNQRILFFKGGRGGTLTELLVRRQREENSNNPKECK